jgi:hypothetical protein
MKNLRQMVRLLVTACCMAGFGIGGASAADRPYTPGSVWTATFVRVKPGMDGTYLRDLATDWKRVMDEARKQQLILSYKVLEGTVSNRDDWNLMLLVESKNWAAFDSADDRFEAIVENMIGPEKKQMETMVKRSDVREIIGTRTMQELNFK